MNTARAVSLLLSGAKQAYAEAPEQAEHELLPGCLNRAGRRAILKRTSRAHRLTLFGKWLRGVGT